MRNERHDPIASPGDILEERVDAPSAADYVVPAVLGGADHGIEAVEELESVAHCRRRHVRRVCSDHHRLRVPVRERSVDRVPHSAAEIFALLAPQDQSIAEPFPHAPFRLRRCVADDRVIPVDAGVGRQDVGGHGAIEVGRLARCERGRESCLDGSRSGIPDEDEERFSTLKRHFFSSSLSDQS
jgi:hypothetical protein